MASDSELRLFNGMSPVTIMCHGKPIFSIMVFHLHLVSALEVTPRAL